MNSVTAAVLIDYQEVSEASATRLGTTPDATCVDTDSRTLSNVVTNSHVAAKDAIEGVININKNTVANCRSGVRTPATTGVGMLIRCFEIAS